jgi:hypothetical protein
MHPAVAGAAGELRIVDAHLAQQTLQRIGPAGGECHEGDVSLGLVARQAGAVGRNRSVGASSDRWDDHLPPPLADLDHQRDVGPHGYVAKGESAVRPGQGADQR